MCPALSRPIFQARKLVLAATKLTLIKEGGLLMNCLLRCRYHCVRPRNLLQRVHHDDHLRWRSERWTTIAVWHTSFLFFWSCVHDSRKVRSPEVFTERDNTSIHLNIRMDVSCCPLANLDARSKIWMILALLKEFWMTFLATIFRQELMPMVLNKRLDSPREL